MSHRKPLVAANWKMHKTRAEAAEFLDAFLPHVDGLGDVEVVICPPYTALETVAERCRDDHVQVAAQNMHDAPEGAYTGEVSAAMLTDLGVDAVVLGHSERRAMFGESDEALARKVPAALAAGLTPILCVGETEAQRDAGNTEAVLRTQVDADLGDTDRGRLAAVVIAYEPVWAIGTGRTATPEQAQEAIAFIRSLLEAQEPAAAPEMRILYGGSVKPENAAEIFGQPDVDGGLVGGASLDPAGFAAICEAAGP